MLAQKNFNLTELIERSKKWDKRSPFLPQHELSMMDDLTDNDIVMRQINCAYILRRNLALRLQRRTQSKCSFNFDYYGDQNWWMRYKVPMRVIFFVFPIIDVVQGSVLRLLLMVVGPLSNWNLVIQMQKKLQAFNKTRVYFEKLMEPVAVSQAESDGYPASYVDFHLYKLALSIKFSSKATQLVIDFVLGTSLLLFVCFFPAFIFDKIDQAGSFMHLDSLQQNILWIQGQPAGFKPNDNLGTFLGNIILSIISKWHIVTSSLQDVRIAIVIIVASFSALGLSVVLAAANDVLFLASIWLMAIYSVFAAMYRAMMSMMGTLIRLFRGFKFNVLRGRNDANNFSVSELFLGVLITTISLFLLPTVAIFYYYAFVTIIFQIMALQLLLIVLQTLVTDFPYYLVCLAVAEPFFLPNSIRMKVNCRDRGIQIVSLPLDKGSLFA